MNMLETLLVLTSLIVACVALFVAFDMRKKWLSSTEQLLAVQQQLNFQQQSIRGLTSGANGMDRRLLRAEASERLLNERQETFENQQAPEQPYSHAIRLVHQGAGISRLVEELELSESEAELIVRLHSLRDSA